MSFSPRRAVPAVLAMAVIAGLIVGPSAFTAQRTDDAMRLASLEYVADLSGLPLDTGALTRVRVGDLEADCAQVRGKPAVVCVSFSHSGFAAVWEADRPGGRVRQILLADEDPATVPNP